MSPATLFACAARRGFGRAFSTRRGLRCGNVRFLRFGVTPGALQVFLRVGADDDFHADFDLLVQLDYTKLDGFGFFGMWSDLEHLLDRRVDLVTENSLADFARESVERDKQLIYERTA